MLREPDPRPRAGPEPIDGTYPMLSRRLFLGGGLLATSGLAGCTGLNTGSLAAAVTEATPPPMPARYGPIPTERFPIPAVPRGVVDPRFWRQRVDNPFPDQATGTIVVDPNAFFLHLIEEGGSAMRYGIGVGRQGFEWSGDAVVQYKREWPTWTPPAEMIEREPELERFSAANGGQPPGLDNPLGARALYLFQGNVDTLYRIHGNPEAFSIGRAVSSGCIRLLNHDVIDLHGRVADGSRVVVRPSMMPSGFY